MIGNRIAVLELRSVRGTGGGPEKTILCGADRADRSKFAVTVCYVRDLRDEIFGIDERASTMDIDYVEIRERHSFDASIWQQLTTLVRDRHVDIVHGHDYKTDLLAYLLAKRLGVVALSTAHGWTGHSDRERRVYYPLHKRLLKRFEKVIAVSSDIRDALVAHGARSDRIDIILNGIDPDSFKRDRTRVAELRAKHGYDAGDVVIGAVGRLEPQKRFDVLLDAFAPLATRRSELRLAIAGDGSSRQALEAQAQRLGLSGRCRFLGHREDVADLHHLFDLFVQSSDYEGTPNAVLEAMAMETPIVATDAGGTRQLAAHGEHAIVVPPGDPASLADGIERCLNDPLAAGRRVAAARRRVEGELSFDARTRRLEAVYDVLMRAAVRA